MEIGQAAGRKGQNEWTFREINFTKDGYLCQLHGVPPCVWSILNNGSQTELCFHGRRRFLGRGQVPREMDVTFHSQGDWSLWAVDILFGVSSLREKKKKKKSVEKFFTENKF